MGGNRTVVPNKTLCDELDEYRTKIAHQVWKCKKKKTAKKIPNFSHMGVSADNQTKTTPQVYPMVQNCSPQYAGKKTVSTAGWFGTNTCEADEFEKSLECMDRSTVKKQPGDWALQASNFREASRLLA